MSKKNRVGKVFLTIATVLLGFNSFGTVKAASSATISISGSSSVNVGADFSIGIEASAPTGDELVTSVGGSVIVDNPDCISIVEVEQPSNGMAFGTTLAYSNPVGNNKAFTATKVKLKAGSNACKTKVSFTKILIGFSGTTKLRPSDVSKEIEVVVPAPKSDDNDLKSLSSNIGTMSPDFASGTTSYNLVVPWNATSVKFTAAANDAKATVSGLTCNLNTSPKACAITVKSESGKNKVYTVNVTKESKPEDPKSTDNKLKDLSSDVGNLSPAFNPDNTEYTLTVPDGTTKVNFTANPNDGKATVTGTTCDINDDNTTCTITVKAEDGTTKNYEVKVTREKKEDPPVVIPEPKDASLKSLDVSGFSLSPVFNPNTTTYNMTVSNNVTSLDVTAIPNDETAKVEISGNTNWQEGINPITITVTATDGNQKVYIVNVTRRALNTTSKPQNDPKSSDNYLKDMIISNGDVTPSFDRNVNNYSIVVSNDVTSLDLEAIKNDEKANVEIVGNSDFKVDKLNTVTIRVTAEDGSLRVYTINVTRSEKKAENKLDSLIIKNGEMSPSFSPDNFTYDVTVAGNVDKLDISAIPVSKDSTVEIIGNENLKTGANTILIKVTDKNGFTQYYRLNVKKSEAKKFLGLTLTGWLILLGVLLLFGLLLFLLLLLLKKKDKDEEDPKTIIKNEKQAPVIEFKPEFNFGSKNGTDDDVVEEGGVLNQYTGNGTLPKDEDTKVITDATVKDAEEVPYDPYDENVTKEELVDAIEEAKRTHDSSKLKMLYAQEVLNRQKAAMKERDKH